MAMDRQAVLTSFVNEMDAQLLVLELQAVGIDAVIRKDDCGGMRPFITAERGIEVLVPRDDLVQASEVAEIAASQEALPSGQNDERGRAGGCLSWFIAVAIAFAAGFAAAYMYNYLQYDSTDLVNFIDGYDRNRDGRTDLEHQYDHAGIYTGGRSDENFDGKWDWWWTFDGDIQVGSKLDVDFNGVIDCSSVYKNGIEVQRDYRPNGSSVLSRRYVYKHSVQIEEWIDEDKDGSFDVVKRFGPFGDVIETERL